MQSREMKLLFANFGAYIFSIITNLTGKENTSITILTEKGMLQNPQKIKDITRLKLNQTEN
jgi:hypothetical protein